MPVFMPVKSDVRELVDQVMAKYHGPLTEAKVTVGLLMAWPSGNSLDAVKLHGYPCAAVARIIPYKQRVKGSEDTEITFDAVRWKELNEDERVALIDHELTHFELARDKKGRLKTDDLGRPKLKTRLHDVQAGWFIAIAQRHGPASFEVKQAREIHGDYYQELFAWGDDMAGEREGSIDPREPLSARFGKDVTVSHNGQPLATMGDLAGAVGGMVDRGADVVRDTFAALLSVGHTESQARAAIDLVLAGGKTFRSVADMVDAIYQQNASGPEAPGTTTEVTLTGAQLGKLAAAMADRA